MDSEKKLYQVPAMQIVNIKQELILLCGSDGVECSTLDETPTGKGYFFGD
ncbi:MAG: hypothetical protein IKH55_11065 [Fibrobacter sp.]|jgi:hypothetical protein|nr:hypothetical protein [Fibrobacter sp.]